MNMFMKWVTLVNYTTALPNGSTTTTLYKHMLGTHACVCANRVVDGFTPPPPEICIYVPLTCLGTVQ